MKNVLIPVDFGSEAINAVKALDIIKDWFNDSFSLTLMHCLGDTNSHLAFQIRKAEAMNRLIEFAHIQVTNYVMEGGVVDCKVRAERLEFLPQAFIESNNIDLVLMGTSGTSEEDILAKTNTGEHVTRHSGPYLIIPLEAKIKRLDQILICVDYEVDDMSKYDFVVELAKSNMAQIHVLHILRTDRELTLHQTRNKEELMAHLNFMGAEFHSYRCEQVVKGILDFATEFETDLICVIPRHNTFFERLFHVSITKMLAQLSKTPIYLNS